MFTSVTCHQHKCNCTSTKFSFVDPLLFLPLSYDICQMTILAQQTMVMIFTTLN